MTRQNLDETLDPASLRRGHNNLVTPAIPSTTTVNAIGTSKTTGIEIGNGTVLTR